MIIGANNAGKSTVLRGLHLLQGGTSDPFPDVRTGTTEATIEIELINGGNAQGWITRGWDDKFTFTAQVHTGDRRSGNLHFTINRNGQTQQGDLRRPPTEPNHFIVPFLSKRKSITYHEDIREQNVLSISPDVSTLAAKLSRLGNPAYPFHTSYSSACESILGFVVTAIPSPSGQRPGIYLPDGQTIPIDQLGEGVPNIAAFLANLAVSEQKLFLVEEPENDLHPQALKALLDLIIESSSRNQFVVSTHSNIVVRHLCSASNSLLYQIKPKRTGLPIESEISAVPDTTDARLAVLSDLGYSLSDLELWDGWLILEEASAERIVRDYLIPWFVPTLSRLRTISAGGASKVNALFEDLHRLFLFTHLTPIYQNRSWVLVDGDEAGKFALEKLRQKFGSKYERRLRSFTATAFESYYPKPFSEAVEEALAHKDDRVRREAKRQLLQSVRTWLDADRSRGKVALEESAAEVISLLQEVADSLQAAGEA